MERWAKKKTLATSQGSQGNTLSCQLAKWKWNKTRELQDAEQVRKGTPKVVGGIFCCSFYFVFFLISCNPPKGGEINKVS